MIRMSTPVFFIGESLSGNATIESFMLGKDLNKTESVETGELVGSTKQLSLFNK